jgi:uncharacterized protein YukE
MSKFVVNPETLEALQQAVMGLAVELEYGSAPTSQYASTSTPYDSWQHGVHGGQLGGADQEFDPFFAAWSASLGQIGQNIENVAKALANAAYHYAEVDDHVCLVNP